MNQTADSLIAEQLDEIATKLRDGWVLQPLKLTKWEDGIGGFGKELDAAPFVEAARQLAGIREAGTIQFPEGAREPAEPQAAVVDIERLQAWLVDPDRRRPELAFTAGPERELADMIEAMQATQQQSPQAGPADFNVFIDALAGEIYEEREAARYADIKLIVMRHMTELAQFLSAQQQPPRLVEWTSCPPSTPGYYWFRKYPSWEPEIVRIVELDDVILQDGWEPQWHSKATGGRCWWAGPLPSPPGA